MRNHTCLLDHHQRSHYDTITIGQEGMMIWALQLINSQKVKFFDSLEEKFNTQHSPNEPNQSQNRSVIDQGNLITRKMCLLLKVKRPVPMRSMKKVFTENSVLQIDQGNLIICLKTSEIHDRSGQLDGRNSSSARTVKEQHAPEVHREVALVNTDNEFDREINEEDIDFNIPGLPHSTVKQLHGVSVRELIQKIENHPHRHALQRDLQRSQSFNPSVKNQKK